MKSNPADVVSKTSGEIRNLLISINSLPRTAAAALKVSASKGVIDLTAEEPGKFLRQVAKLHSATNELRLTEVEHLAYAAAYLELCKAAGEYRALTEWTDLVNDLRRHSYHAAAYLWARVSVGNVIEAFSDWLWIDDLIDGRDDAGLYEGADAFFEHQSAVAAAVNSVCLPANAFAQLALEEVQALLIVRQMPDLFQDQTVVPTPVEDERGAFCYSRLKRRDGKQEIILKAFNKQFDSDITTVAGIRNCADRYMVLNSLPDWRRKPKKQK